MLFVEPPRQRRTVLNSCNQAVIAAFSVQDKVAGGHPDVDCATLVYGCFWHTGTLLSPIAPRVLPEERQHERCGEGGGAKTKVSTRRSIYAVDKIRCLRQVEVFVLAREAGVPVSRRRGGMWLKKEVVCYPSLDTGYCDILLAA